MSSRNNIGNMPAGRPAREVDLHLRPGTRGDEALERQLALVRGEINRALRSQEKEITFIHGSGSGKLRDEIHAIIEAEYPACTFHDAPFTKYGYNGATTVTIRK